MEEEGVTKIRIIPAGGRMADRISHTTGGGVPLVAHVIGGVPQAEVVEAVNVR